MFPGSQLTKVHVSQPRTLGADLGTLSFKKNGKKRGHCLRGAGGGSTPVPFLAQILQLDEDC